MSIKNLLLSFCVLVFISFGFSQNDFILNNDASPSLSPMDYKFSPKGDMTIEFNYSTGKLATYACETDGDHFFVACHHNQYAPGALYRFDNVGNYVDSIVLPITGAIAMAYDGDYFYTIGSIGNVFDDREIYVWDFTNNYNNPDDILLDTITFLPPDSLIWDFLSMNCAAYSPDDDAFWIGNWTGTALLVDKQGQVLDAFPGEALGGHNLTGIAYDNETAGGPYLWCSDVDNDLIRQYHIPSKTYTGNAYSYTPEINTSGEMFLSSEIVPGKRVLGVYGQGGRIVGYDLDASIVVVENDLVVNQTNMDLYFPENVETTIITNITNNGLLEVTEFQYSYQINGGTINTMSINTNLVSFESMDFEHDVPWIPEEGIVELKIWTSMPNGVDDEDPDSDTIIETKYVYANGALRKRVVLHEEFTSSTCDPCVGAAEHLQELFSNNNPEDYTFVAYQMNWPGSGDIYYDPQGGGIRNNFYDVGGIPHMNVDSYEFHPSNYMQSDFDIRKLDSTLMELEATWYLNNEEVFVNVDIKPTFSYTENLKLYVTVIENQTEGNVGSNGMTEFHNVEMKMIPNGNGSSLDPMQSGVSVQIEKSASLSNTNVEEWDDLAVIVWVQNSVTKEVIQSVNATIYTGLHNINKNDLSIFQKNNDQLYIRSSQGEVNYQILNMNGQLIKNGKKNSGLININDLKSGVYIIRINDSSSKHKSLKFIRI